MRTAAPGTKAAERKYFFDANLICYEKMCKNMKKMLYNKKTMRY
jgi:hypothetical protein